MRVTTGIKPEIKCVLTLVFSLSLGWPLSIFAASKTTLTSTQPKTSLMPIQLKTTLTSTQPKTTNPTPNAEILTKRQIFLQAEAALTAGKLPLYKTLKNRLADYVLYPYLLFSEYDRRMSSITSEEFTTFMNRYPDSPLAEQLRFRWLQTKAKEEDWDAFLKAYQPTEDVSLQCQYLWGSILTSKDRGLLLKQITPLWLSGKKTPKSCEAVFSYWEKSDLMTRPLIWQRIKLAIQQGNDELARKTARYLKKPEVALAELWLMILDNPFLVTQQKYFSGNHPAYLEMIVDGVSRIANNKPETAIQIWQDIGQRYPFTERHWGLVVRAIGIAFALQKHPDAEKWLAKVPNLYANQSVHEWRIRVALAKEDWPNTAKWIKTLPVHLSKAEEWQYWNARALEMMNRREESQIILAKLGKIRSYYGILANHQLLKPYQNNLHKLPIEKGLIESMARKPAILRARELYHIDRYTKAKAEWQFITNQMNDTEKHAAAHLALKWDLANWSILALTKATNKNDLALRFPVVYAHHILREAQKHELDPAWIFAITRQESAFIPHAKSSAGALGLMQLIPSTAEMVSRKKQIPLMHSTQLLEPHTNIQLGSGYLKMMLDKHNNNAVLATAAYNAGPGRIRKWLPTFDMAADLWIETIPFKETREYVKNVLTYTAIYQEILGKKSSLRAHMPFVPSDKQANNTTSDPKQAK